MGRTATQPAAQAAGLNADRGRILVDSINREAELEEITDAVLLSRSDDFNAFAASQLRADLGHGHVFRVAPDPDEPDLLPPTTDNDILGAQYLTLSELTKRLTAGARFVGSTVQMDNGAQSTADESVLFVIGSNGAMRPATRNNRPAIHNGDTVIRFLAPT